MHSINGLKKNQSNAIRSLLRSRKTLLWVVLGILFLFGLHYVLQNHSKATKSSTFVKLTNEAQGELKNVVVFDAGSTGSRVHIFHFDARKNGDLILLGDDVQKVKPGLGEYKGKAKSAAESLKSLVEYAKERIPQEQQKSTQCFLHATAGLRFLGMKEAQEILDAVYDYLKDTSDFIVSQPTILEGQDEGGFAWICINYLLGNLGQGRNATVSVVDLGGGSVQQAYAIDKEQIVNAPSKDYLRNYSIQGSKYDIYVHSWLMYGLNAARYQIIKHSYDRNKGSPCIGSDVNTEYVYGDKVKVYGPSESEPQTSFTNCAREVEDIMALGQECGMTSKEHCSFNGTWDGGLGEGYKVFYISSYFWDRAVDIGIIKDKDANTFETTPNAFMVAAEKLCQTKQDKMEESFPEIKDFPAKERPYLCTDLTYCYTLLTRGFKIHDLRKIYLVKKINYQKELVEVAWPLGAALRSFA